MHCVTVSVTRNQTKLAEQCHTGFTVTTVTALLVIFPSISLQAYFLYKSRSGESRCLLQRLRKRKDHRILSQSPQGEPTLFG
jgi:hypothetical protein